MSANSRAVRRRCTATLLLMTLQGTACLAWHTEGVAPQVVLATQQPRALRVMRTDGRQLVLQHPVLRGDTLVGISDQQEEVRIALFWSSANEDLFLQTHSASTNVRA